MTERMIANEQAQAFFNNMWKNADPWNFEGSEFEQSKYMRQFEMLNGRRYARALEIGCGAGVFTRLLARIAERVVALDVAPAAIRRAREVETGPGGVDFRVANIMEYDLSAEGPWDLLVMSETIYYLGWLYPFFDVAWLAAKLFAATNVGGRLMMANTCSGVEDYLLRPWIIRTYRDLFLNVGYRLEVEKIFRGIKDGVHLEVLVSLFTKASEGTIAKCG